MKNVTYYNAGAGSGKTYQLITILSDLIADGSAKPQELILTTFTEDGSAKPQELILTTFTEKAAAEFREKAKSRLYERGMFEAARQIDNAMIGTVHSVCKQMIDKYWYLLGLVPNMAVIDDDSKAFYMSQSLGDLPTPAEYHILRDFAYTFGVPNEWKNGVNEFFWRQHLESVISYATNYSLTDFTLSKQKSLDFIAQFVDPTVKSISISSTELEDMLKEAHDYVDKSNRIKDKEKYYEKFNALFEGSTNPTIAWYSKVADTIDPKYGTTCSAVTGRLGQMWCSTEVYDAQKDYIDTLFNLASRWQQKYAQFKRDKNLIDFDDMEHYMHQLLQIDAAKKDISQSFRYLFVDEFQDSSPIQIQLFTELSQLVHESYWVGDYKQSIYGFRGTDIDMVKAVKDSIDPKKVKPLDNSWRSLPPIVKVNNNLFTRLFDGQLKENEIVLHPKRADVPSFSSLRYIITKKGADSFARCVAKLMQEGAEPSNIAVLARTNSELSNIAAELHSKGIASSLGDAELVGTQTWALVKSLLGLIDNPNDTLARAQVALLTDPRFSTRAIIEQRLLQMDDPAFLSDVPLIEKVLALRDTTKTQSVAALVEQLIIELGLYEVVKQVEDDSPIGVDCLKCVISQAQQYETHCLQLNMPASVSGFVLYFEEAEPTGFGNPDGVQLLTYHKSKGLEREYVILTSLDHKIVGDSKFVKRNIYGVQFERTATPSPDNINPEIYLRLTPWIYATKEKVPAVIDVILSDTDTYKAAVKTARQEECRLFYVGMTRPRNVLVVSVNEKRSGLDLTLLEELGYSLPPDHGPAGGRWDIFNTGDVFVDYTPTDEEAALLDDSIGHPVETMLVATPGHPSAERRYISPSGVKGTAAIGNVHNFNHRIPLKDADDDMAQVGNCIHHIYAGIEEHRTSGIDIRDIIRSHGMEGVLVDSDSILTAWNNLKDYLTATYGAPLRTWHERPFRMERDGQTIVGSIDLVWRTANGDILLDYKTNAMGQSEITDPDSDYFAGHYGGQLATYREALEASGEHVITTLIYYPVSGLLVELK